MNVPVDILIFLCGVFVGESLPSLTCGRVNRLNFITNSASSSLCVCVCVCACMCVERVCVCVGLTGLGVRECAGECVGGDLGTGV